MPQICHVGLQFQRQGFLDWNVFVMNWWVKWCDICI